VLAILLLSLAVLLAQGLRMAQDRQERLEPAVLAGAIALPCDNSIPPAEIEVRRQSRRAMLQLSRDCDDASRLAIIQELPEREILRWAEAGPAADALVVPLEGLGDGIYRIVTLPAGEVEAPREMDRPIAKWPVRARMLLRTVEP